MRADVTKRGKSRISTLLLALVTDVNNIVLRLKALDVEEVLHVDIEFLCAVYGALPSMTHVEWLRFDKSCHNQVPG